MDYVESRPSWYSLMTINEYHIGKNNLGLDLELLRLQINLIAEMLGVGPCSWYQTDPNTGTFYGSPLDPKSIIPHMRIVDPDGNPTYLREWIDHIREIGGAKPFNWRYTPSVLDYTDVYSSRPNIDSRQILEMFQAIGRVSSTDSTSSSNFSVYKTLRRTRRKLYTGEISHGEYDTDEEGVVEITNSSSLAYYSNILVYSTVEDELATKEQYNDTFGIGIYNTALFGSNPSKKVTPVIDPRFPDYPPRIAIETVCSGTEYRVGKDFEFKNTYYRDNSFSAAIKVYELENEGDFEDVSLDWLESEGEGKWEILDCRIEGTSPDVSSDGITLYKRDKDVGDYEYRYLYEVSVGQYIGVRETIDFLVDGGWFWYDYGSGEYVGPGYYVYYLYEGLREPSFENRPRVLAENSVLSPKEQNVVDRDNTSSDLEWECVTSNSKPSRWVDVTSHGEVIDINDKESYKKYVWIRPKDYNLTNPDLLEYGRPLEEEYESKIENIKETFYSLRDYEDLRAYDTPLTCYYIGGPASTERQKLEPNPDWPSWLAAMVSRQYQGGRVGLAPDSDYLRPENEMSSYAQPGSFAPGNGYNAAFLIDGMFKSELNYQSDIKAYMDDRSSLLIDRIVSGSSKMKWLVWNECYLPRGWPLILKKEDYPGRKVYD